MDLIWKQNGLKNIMGMIGKIGTIVSVVNFLNLTIVPWYSSLKILFILKKIFVLWLCKKMCSLLKDTLASHGSLVKNPPANAGDLSSIPGSGRCPGEGNGNPLQYSCLGNHMDRGVWQDTVHGAARVGHDLVTKPPPPRQLSGSTSLFPFFTFPRQL